MNSTVLGGIIGVIDELGHEAPLQRVVSDGYKTNRNLPDGHPDKLDLPDSDDFKFVPMTLADVIASAPRTGELLWKYAGVPHHG